MRRSADMLCCTLLSMEIKKRKEKRLTWAWRQSLRGVLSRKRQAETDAHVHSSDSNKEPIVGSTCLRKYPVCSWLGGSAAKSLFITPTASLCPLPLCHVHLLSSPSDYLGGFISMQWVCRERVEIGYRDPDKVGGSSFDWSHGSHVLRLKFHNTGNPHRVIQWAAWASPSSLLSSALRLHPASCGGHAPSHQRLLLATSKKLSRDLITPLRADSCMQPAHRARKPIKLRFIGLSNATVTSLNKYNLIFDHSYVS